MANERLYSARECARELNISELAIHRLLRDVKAPKQLGVFAVPDSFLKRLKAERSKSPAVKAAAARKQVQA